MGTDTDPSISIELTKIRLDRSSAELLSNKLGSGGRISISFSLTINTKELENNPDYIESASITLEVGVSGFSTEDDEKLFHVAGTMTGAFSIIPDHKVLDSEFQDQANLLAVPIYSEVRTYLLGTLEKMNLRSVPVPWIMPSISLTEDS